MLEDPRHCARQQTGVGRGTRDRVSLSRASLAVCKDRAIIALEHCLDNSRNVLIRVILGGLWRQHLV
eukprot:scaffold170055_cov30-Tisochrysis_lutea.AAC.1